MDAESIKNIVDTQRKFFSTGVTIPVKNRIEKLKQLHATIKKYEHEIAEALKSDLGKSEYESYMCEIGLVLSEITYMIKHTCKFAKERRVHTPLSQFASRSYVKPSPYGVTLIMSPWNYPFLLTLDPLVDAISAGNTAVVKPSAYSPSTSAIIYSISYSVNIVLFSVFSNLTEGNQLVFREKSAIVPADLQAAVHNEILWKEIVLYE